MILPDFTTKPLKAKAVQYDGSWDNEDLLKRWARSIANTEIFSLPENLDKSILTLKNSAGEVYGIIPGDWVVQIKGRPMEAIASENFHERFEAVG